MRQSHHISKNKKESKLGCFGTANAQSRKGQALRVLDKKSPPIQVVFFIQKP